MRAKLMRVLGAWRLARVAMMAMITGATAFGFGAPVGRAALAGLLAAFLALGGFYLDYMADWRTDRAAGKLLNPIASGEMSLWVGWSLVGVGVCGTAALSLALDPWILLPAGGVLAIVGGLAVGWLDTPVLRAISLGAIQALYVLVGGLAAGERGPGVALTALFLLFAMTGGRVMGDVRDLPHDTRSQIMTIPQRYGLRWASAFLVVNELVSYAFALAVYGVGALGRGYLYCVIGIVVLGIAINALFVMRPTPRRADITNRLSFGVLGMLYVLGMILGRTA